MNDETRSELRQRLDILAAEATDGTHLNNPSVPASRAFRAPALAKFGAAFAAIAVIVGGVVLAQRGGDPEPDAVAVAVVGDDSELAPEDALPRAECTDPDVRATTSDLLVSGVPTYDYNPAGSFAALAEISEFVVTGTAVSIERVIRSDEDLDALSVVHITDVESLDGRPPPDITEFSYNSWWADRSSDDPLATARRFAPELRFVAFLSVRPDGSGGYSPGPEGLYVACGTDSPITPVFASAAGPDDPVEPTINQLSDLLAPRIECSSPQAAADIARRLVAGAPFESEDHDSPAALVEGSATTILGSIDSADSFSPDDSEEQLGRLVVSGVESADDEPFTRGLFYPAYPIVEPDRSRALLFDGLLAIAFVSPTQPSLVGGSSVVSGGLYVACDLDDPAVAVLGSVFGSEQLSLRAIGDIAAVLRDELRAEDENRQEQARADFTAAGVAIRDALVQFGTGEQLAIEEIPLADEVALGLHDRIYKTLTKDQLRDQSAWIIDEPEGYAEFSGPFDALEMLAAGPETEVTLGQHPHCAGPALGPPAGFEEHVQVSIQPAEGTIDSCIPWFSVDLWLEPATGAIAAVTLALFGP